MKQEYNIANRNGLSMNVVTDIVKKPKGTAIIHHGYVGNMSSPTIQLMRRTFNDLGFTTITPNTTHNYNDSDGDYQKMTLRGHCEDLVDCVLNTLDSKNYTGPLVLAGHSAGGYSAIVASSELEGKYKPALTIASAPLISGERYMQGWKEVIKAQNISPDKFIKHWENKGFIECGSDSGPDTLELHWSVMMDWCQHDLIKDEITPNNPTVLIGGEIDPFIRQQDVIDYFEMSRIKEVSFIEDADHCYTGQEKAFEEHLRETINSYFPKPGFLHQTHKPQALS
ncbi:MAG: alpha/beta hydrolase [Alphaproteobacteria bacterium]|nr:alpha/beta hydrolase [Alphaproteobacteria bacterium]